MYGNIRIGQRMLALLLLCVLVALLVWIFSS